MTRLHVAAAIICCVAGVSSCAGARPDPDDEEPTFTELDPNSYGIKLDDIARRKNVVVPGLSPGLQNAIGRELSTPPDLVGALNGYAKSCASGEAVGCYMLALLDRPRFVKDDKKRRAALEPFETACGGDVPAGCHLAALVLDDDSGNPVDPKSARAHYEKACRLGFQPSCVREADYRMFASSIPAEVVRHIELRSAACQAGFPAGCRPVATRGYAGDSMRACELGDLDACLSVSSGPKAAIARKHIQDLGKSLRAICDASGHVIACSDAERSVKAAKDRP